MKSAFDLLVHGPADVVVERVQTGTSYSIGTRYLLQWVDDSVDLAAAGPNDVVCELRSEFGDEVPVHAKDFRDDGSLLVRGNPAWPEVRVDAQQHVALEEALALGWPSAKAAAEGASASAKRAADHERVKRYQTSDDAARIRSEVEAMLGAGSVAWVALPEDRLLAAERSFEAAVSAICKRGDQTQDGAKHWDTLSEARGTLASMGFEPANPFPDGPLADLYAASTPSKATPPELDEYASIVWNDDEQSGFIIRNEGDGLYKAEEWRRGDIVDNHYGPFAEVEAWVAQERSQHLVFRAGMIPPALPQVDTSIAFTRTFWRIAEEGYRNCDPDNFDSKEDFDCDVANAISDALSCLGIEEPGDEDRAAFLSPFYDLLEKAGLREWHSNAPDADDAPASRSALTPTPG